MALNAYLTIKGAVQGQIKGSVTQKGREGQIAVYAYHHEVISPRDSASGLPTGKRQHKPLSITKEIDKSTPLLLRVLVTNEVLTEVVLHFFAASSAGVEVQNFTIKLSNATIASISENMTLNKIDPGIKLPVLEEITFTYQKIEWKWVDRGITTVDDWSNIAT
jgi:type VI secretion system secreted protein Hcp